MRKEFEAKTSAEAHQKADQWIKEQGRSIRVIENIGVVQVTSSYPGSHKPKDGPFTATVIYEKAK